MKTPPRTKFSDAKMTGLLIGILKKPNGNYVVMGRTRNSKGRNILAYLPAPTRAKAQRTARLLLKLYPNSKIIQEDG